MDKIKVPIPPLELQQKFSETISQIEILKYQTKDKFFEVENLFNSLLQRAFKGELQFNDEAFIYTNPSNICTIKLKESYQKDLLGGSFPRFSAEDKKKVEAKLNLTIPEIINIIKTTDLVWEIFAPNKKFLLKIEQEQLVFCDAPIQEKETEAKQKTLF